MKNITYTTDPAKRCMYCKGRLVKTYMNDKIIDINLDYTNGIYYCKDKKECQRNLESENTIIIVNEHGYEITKDYGKPVMEVTYKNGLDWGDEFGNGC